MSIRSCAFQWSPSSFGRLKSGVSALQRHIVYLIETKNYQANRVFELKHSISTYREFS